MVVVGLLVVVVVVVVVMVVVDVDVVVVVVVVFFVVLDRFPNCGGTGRFGLFGVFPDGRFGGTLPFGDFGVGLTASLSNFLLARFGFSVVAGASSSMSELSLDPSSIGSSSFFSKLASISSSMLVVSFFSTCFVVGFLVEVVLIPSSTSSISTVFSALSRALVLRAIFLGFFA